MSSSLLYLEVEEYARAKLGIDPETEPHLLHIARQGLTAKLPEPWKPWYVLLFSVLRYFWLKLKISIVNEPSEISFFYVSFTYSLILFFIISLYMVLS